jgi:hypothetical protein
MKKIILTLIMTCVMWCMVNAQTNILFSDNFNRVPNPITNISPWNNYTGVSGTYVVINNALIESNGTYGCYVYYPTNLNNYSFTTTFRFGSVNNWGGGMGARLNSATGARYAIAIHPDNSGGGPNILKLVNFTNWTTDFTLKQININPTGTNLHSYSMTLSNNFISVFMDGVEVITNYSDTSYSAGGIDLEVSQAPVSDYFYSANVTSLPNTSTNTSPSTNTPPSSHSSVLLGWNSVTNQIVAGFNIYYGGASRVYTNEINAGLNTSLAISNLMDGATYYFAATTYSAAGAESSLSDEVSFTTPQTTNAVPSSPPAPIGLRATP